MLELSINVTAVVCLSLIILVTYANIANDIRSSILGMLCAVMVLCAFLSVRNTSTIAIILGIIYVSIFSLFLTIAYDSNSRKWKVSKYYWLGFIVLASVALILSNPYLTSIKTTSACSGIADVTLLLFSISLLVLSSLISFLSL